MPAEVQKLCRLQANHAAGLPVPSAEHSPLQTLSEESAGPLEAAQTSAEPRSLLCLQRTNFPRTQALRFKLPAVARALRRPVPHSQARAVHEVLETSDAKNVRRYRSFRRWVSQEASAHFPVQTPAKGSAQLDNPAQNAGPAKTLRVCRLAKSHLGQKNSQSQICTCSRVLPQLPLPKKGSQLLRPKLCSVGGEAWRCTRKLGEGNVQELASVTGPI